MRVDGILWWRAEIGTKQGVMGAGNGCRREYVYSALQLKELPSSFIPTSSNQDPFPADVCARHQAQM